MATFKNIFNNMQLAEKGDTKPIKKLGGLTANFTGQKFSQKYLDTFFQIAEDEKIIERFAEIYSGKKVNKTEGRAVGHFEYRKKRNKRLESVLKEQEKMYGLAERILQKQYHALIFIGIGGSQLGPELLQQAINVSGANNILFITSPESGDLERLALLRAENRINECAFIIASKSFSTLETLEAYRRLIDWKMLNNENTYAITANKKAAQEFGVPDKNILTFGETVGGRYSIWSPINLLSAVQGGSNSVEDFAIGGFEADENILNTSSLEDILSIYMSAQDILHNNILKNETTAILSYEWGLRDFYKYAQQLEMESNGKQINQNGEKVDYQTNSIIWGGYGPVSQHSFYQQIFQGTKDINLYFLAITKNDTLSKAQYLAQTKSLSEGTESKEPPHKQTNKRRFTTIEMSLSEPTAREMGNLIATWENKTILNSLIWNINAFDQWGVELGKANTKWNPL